MRIIVAAFLALISLNFGTSAGAKSARVTCNGATYTSPDGIARCSKDFYFSVTCNSGDALATWAGPYAVAAGNPPTERAGIRPWETKSISIVGWTIAFKQAVPGFQFAFVGNNYNPDPMAWAARGDISFSTTVFYPPGFSFQFPSSADARPKDYFDLHIGCTDGTDNGFVTVYYVLNGR